jgi:hypothetical protein
VSSLQVGVLAAIEGTQMKTLIFAAILASSLASVVQAGFVVPITVRSSVCDNGFCRPMTSKCSGVVIQQRQGKTLLLSCRHAYPEGGKLLGLDVGGHRGRLITFAADCDLSLVEIDGEPEDWKPFVLPEEDVGITEPVFASGYAYGGDKLKHVPAEIKADAFGWIERNGWPPRGRPQLVVSKSVPDGFSGGSVSRENADGDIVLYGVIVQSSTDPAGTLFIPASKINDFLARVQTKKVYEVSVRTYSASSRQQVKSGVGADVHLGPLGTLGAILGCKTPAGQQTQAPEQSQPVPPPVEVPAVPTASLNEEQIRGIITQWFVDNRQRIAAVMPQPKEPVIPPSLQEDQVQAIINQWFQDNRQAIVASLPIPKPQAQVIPPITVEAWEQVLNADGAPVGEPVLKGSQSYPQGSPVKIIHYKMLAK